MIETEFLPQAQPRLVFVYGTLRRGEQRDINRLQPAPRFVGMAHVAGLLYDLGSYPGLRLGEGGVVSGEVYEIDAKLERRLDEIEEVWPEPNGEYTKREVAVHLDMQLAEATLAQHIECSCLVYEATLQAVKQKRLIEGGDWIAYRKRSGQR
jgi:gamma-glutamylcyclotransferase (GGCT)/AIG2-like uncharacterized protein YtfP